MQSECQNPGARGLTAATVVVALQPVVQKSIQNRRGQVLLFLSGTGKKHAQENELQGAEAREEYLGQGSQPGLHTGITWGDFHSALARPAQPEIRI